MGLPNALTSKATEPGGTGYIIPREWAEWIVEMGNVCDSEGLGPNSEPMMRRIFELYPDLQEKSTLDYLKRQ